MITFADKFYAILNTYILSTLSYIGESFCILSIILIMLCFLGRVGTFTKKSIYPVLVFVGIGTILNIYSVCHDYFVMRNHWNEPFQESIVRLTDKSEYSSIITIVVILAIILSVLLTFSEHKILNCLIAGFMIIFYETYISVEMLCTTIYFTNKSRNYIFQGSFIYEELEGAFSYIFILAYMFIMASTFFALYLGMIRKQRTLYVGWKSRILFVSWEILMVCIAYIPIFIGGTLKQQEKYMGYELGMILPLMGIIVPLFMLILISNRNAFEKSILQEEYISAELTFINQYKRNQHETRAFRHDIINNLSMLSTMYAEGKYDDASEHLSDLLGDIRAMSPKYITGDEMLDCIVGMKISKMEGEGISFTLDGVLDGGLDMKPVDICTIFANAIDNAIEACEKLEEKSDRWIKLSIKRTDRFFSINLCNSMLDDKKQSVVHRLFGGGDRFTTKEDKSLHGYGTQNMQKVISKYDGIEKVNAENGVFTLSIIFPRTN